MVNPEGRVQVVNLSNWKGLDKLLRSEGIEKDFHIELRVEYRDRSAEVVLNLDLLDAVKLQRQLSDAILLAVAGQDSRKENNG